MVVYLYGDKHDSEKYAREIQKGLAEQTPEAIMVESPDLKGDRASYLLSSFTKYATLGAVYKEFGLDVNRLDSADEKYTMPMYNVDYRKLEKSLEALFEKFSISQSVEKIIQHDKKVLDKSKDHAITSLFRNITFQRNNKRNTLLPRLGVIIKQKGSDIYAIDVPDESIYNAAAKAISKAPEDPKNVEKLIKKARNGETNKKETLVARNILDKTGNVRELLMAKQIKDIIKQNNYKNSAAITGRGHTKSIKEELDDKKIKTKAVNTSSKKII